ncbi:MAG TPA: DnaA N-terminal domain-containing protein, partial [Methylibium sp.]|nr:DnaA N-terminal domain-containing protein [Methylibium sp.]
MSDDMWSRGCERLAAVLPEQQFNTWIRPLSAAEFTERGDTTVATLRVPNRFMLDWIRAQYASRIESVLSEVGGKPVLLELQLAARPGLAPRPAPLPVAASSPDAAPSAPARPAPLTLVPPV